MQTKVLGRTGIHVSVVGLGGGCLGLPTPQSVYLQYGENPDQIDHSDKKLGVAAVHAAIDAGMTIIDTAPLYFNSEKMIGQALKERPTNGLIISTKIGMRRRGDEFDHSFDAAMKSFAESQLRLGLDRLPIVYIHDPMGFSFDFVMSKKGTMGALLQLKAEKRIDFIGIAANDPETAADYIATGEFDVATVSDAWSLINQKAAKRIFPEAEKWDVGLVITTAIERGLLATGHLLAGVSYHGRHFTPEILSQVKSIQTLCDQFEIPLLAAANVVIPEDFWFRLSPLIKDFDYTALSQMVTTSYSTKLE